MKDKLNGCIFWLKWWLFRKYNTICNKVSTDIRKDFDSQPDYKHFLKTKIKSHGDEVTDVYNKSIPRVDSRHTCLPEISLDSALEKDEDHYSQLF